MVGIYKLPEKSGSYSPKIKWNQHNTSGKYHKHCCRKNPCTSSSCGRMVYIYPEKNIHAYLSTLRGTEEWDNNYKVN